MKGNNLTQTTETGVIKKVNPQIRHYIETEILPQYHSLKGHTDQHIKDVIRRSFQIAQNLDGINLNMVYVIAAYHDLGRLVDNKTHHLESAKMLKSDQALKSFFTEAEIQTMAEAAEDHRASLGHEPRSVYGKIVSCADRATDISEPLARAYDYGKSLYPDWSEEDIIERARLHLREKYSRNGYAVKTMYFQNPEFDEFIRKIEEITATKEKFYKIQVDFNNKRFKKENL